jgi:hypothetical protein
MAEQDLAPLFDVAAEAYDRLMGRYLPTLALGGRYVRRRARLAHRRLPARSRQSRCRDAPGDRSRGSGRDVLLTEVSESSVTATARYADLETGGPRSPAVQARSEHSTDAWTTTSARRCARVPPS